MAATFAYTVDDEWIEGNKRHKRGTFTTAGGSTGGDVLTGLQRCEGFENSPLAAAVVANVTGVNEAFPLSGGAVTVVVAANGDWAWHAWGN